MDKDKRYKLNWITPRRPVPSLKTSSILSRALGVDDLPLSLVPVTVHRLKRWNSIMNAPYSMRFPNGIAQ